MRHGRDGLCWVSRFVARVVCTEVLNVAAAYYSGYAIAR